VEFEPNIGQHSRPAPIAIFKRMNGDGAMMKPRRLLNQWHFLPIRYRLQQVIKPCFDLMPRNAEIQINRSEFHLESPSMPPPSISPEFPSRAGQQFGSRLYFQFGEHFLRDGLRFESHCSLSQTAKQSCLPLRLLPAELFRIIGRIAKRKPKHARDFLHVTKPYRIHLSAKDAKYSRPWNARTLHQDVDGHL